MPVKNHSATREAIFAGLLSLIPPSRNATQRTAPYRTVTERKHERKKLCKH